MPTEPEYQRREVMGIYKATPPTLADGEKYPLTLTSDAKLRVDDPTTQEKVDDIEDKLDSATHGLAALKALIDAVEAKLDVPANFKADVSALALEATLTAMKGTTWSTETLKAIYDAIAALPAERGTDSAALASVCTEARLAHLDADISSRSSHGDPDPSGYIDHSIGDLITRTKGLDDIHDDIDALPAERGTDSALLAANYNQFTKGLTEHAAMLGKTYADIAESSYHTLLSVTGAGYITGIVIQLHLEQEQYTDFIIEVDGTEVPPFEHHAQGVGNCETGSPANCACLLTTWHADYTHVFLLHPMWRFDSSFRIRLYNNRTAVAYKTGSLGHCTYLTE